ncbi:MAG: LacI family DNA-binding transcriptional regulator [Planctomycetota bacterium]|jgi:DNA-binding LacI/PurR family transcriptional regulator
MAEKRIRDIAGELGVSVSTVSKAINHRPGVSSAMRERVLEYCESVQYKPNPFAQDFARHTRNPGGGALRNIGYILAGCQFSSPPYSFYLDGLSRAADEEQYSILPALISPDLAKAYELPAFLREDRVSGLLLSGTIKPQLLDLLRAQGITFVLLGTYDPMMVKNDLSVTFDLDMAMELAVVNVVEKGSRCPGLLDDGGRTYYSQHLQQAFVTACERHGVSPYSYGGDTPKALTFEACCDWFEGEGREVDALIAPNGHFAEVAAATLLQLRGRRACMDFPLVAPPEVILLSAFDGAALELHHDRLGETGVQLLLQLAERNREGVQAASLRLMPTVKSI